MFRRSAIRMHGQGAARCAAALLAAALCAQQPGAPARAGDGDAFVERWCIECHGGDTVKGKLDLTVPPYLLVDALWRWSRLRDRVSAHEMPPPDADQPDAGERAAFAAWVDATLDAEVPKLPPDPGRVTVRRLSRAQWANAVRDLLGVAASTDGFPADDLGYGFDSIGDALTFSTLHLEHWLAGARAVAAQVFDGEDREHPARRTFEAEGMRLVDDRGASLDGDVANLYTNATIEQTVTLPRDGDYRLRIAAGATQAGDEPARMVLAIDGRRIESFDVPNEALADFVAPMRLSGGTHRIALSFVNDFWDPDNPDPKRRDRNLRIDLLEVAGPVDRREVPAEQQWLHAAATGRTDQAKLSHQVEAMLPRLWRRRVGDEERRRLVRAGRARLDAGESLADAQRFVLTAALTSPHFLFRIEPGRDGASVAPVDAQALASRLSFFLWASAPDEQLQRRAPDILRDDAALVVEVDRMLTDPRAARIATDFAAQWLELRGLDERTPDPARFPGFDDALRRSLRRQTELLFDSVLREGRDVRALLDGEFTHVDATLAAFYGLPPVEGDGFRRVALDAAHRDRGGLLGHGSMLAVTSNPTRTSPVKRGKWILENLLGQGPPPPPPGNDSLRGESRIDSSASLREQLAQHRERAACAVCHVRMDAFGLALERYDVIGRYRAEDKAGAIDCSSELPDGTRVEGLAGLRALLVDDPAFVRTIAHKLFVYAVGRDLRPVDALRIDTGVRRLLGGELVTLRDLVLLIVRDQAFRMRGP